MATSPQNFTLDRNIFNESLYSQLRDFWLSEVPPGTVIPTMEMSKRWFGLGKSQEEKDAFDRQCHENFGHALETLAPSHLALPPFVSYEDDLKNAASISAPLLSEVKGEKDAEASSKTLLSLILLLDQMTRNIYRDHAGLRLVYGHYDRLSFTLLRSSLNLSPNPLDHESVKNRPVFQTWYLLPLMHSEHVPSHELYDTRFNKMRDALADTANAEAVKFLDDNSDFAKKHVEPLRQFGRYPHRNQALGRTNTEQEEEYLRSADTFGVKQQTQDPDRSEL